MKKLFIETYGCQMNVADSEVVAAIMQMAGYELCDNEDEAQAPIIITANADAINVDIVFIVFCFFVRKSFLGGVAFWAGRPFGRGAFWSGKPV